MTIRFNTLTARLSKAVLSAAFLLALAPLASAQYSTPVRDVDNPARNAVSILYNCVGVSTTGSVNCTTDLVIPSGYRLVVESVLGIVGLDGVSPANDVLLDMETSLTGSFHWHQMIAYQYRFSTTFPAFAYSSSVKFYSDTVPSLKVIANSASYSTSTVSYITMHGFLIKK